MRLLTRATTTLPLCPDVVERLGDTNAFAVCSYLLGDGGAKSGGVALARVAARALDVAPALACDAVFDGRWAPDARGEGGAFCAATARAGLALFAARGGGGGGGGGDADADLSLALVAAGAVDADAGVSALAVDWAGDAAGAAGARVVAGLSDGRVWVGELDGAGGGARARGAWAAHARFGAPIEVWTVAACPAARDVIWSGGDDARLCGWDARAGGGAPTFTSAAHGAGVTSIAWCPAPSGAHVVATGSYDERLRLWDDRATRAPLSETRVGGGVWRARWRPALDAAPGGAWGGGAALAIAAMYAGVAIYDARDTGAPLPLLARRAAESIAYAVAWAPPPPPRAGAAAGAAAPLLLSSSFYDKRLDLWEAEEEAAGEEAAAAEPGAAAAAGAAAVQSGGAEEA